MPGKMSEGAAGTGFAFSWIVDRSKSDRVWQASEPRTPTLYHTRRGPGTASAACYSEGPRSSPTRSGLQFRKSRSRVAGLRRNGGKSCPMPCEPGSAAIAAVPTRRRFRSTAPGRARAVPRRRRYSQAGFATASSFRRPSRRGSGRRDRRAIEAPPRNRDLADRPAILSPCGRPSGVRVIPSAARDPAPFWFGHLGGGSARPRRSGATDGSYPAIPSLDRRI